MSKVLVMESSYENCAEAVERAFAAFPLEIAGKRVVIKPNALKPCNPDTDTAMVTHYKILEAVIKKVETLGPRKILVGDSVGTEFYGRSDEVCTEVRFKEVAGPYYTNMSKNLRMVKLMHPFEREVAVLADVLDAEVYISLPKMKTHGLTMTSGGIKNNYGLLSGAQKSWYHYYTVSPERFARILVEMFRLRPPDLVIMDAVLAMAGYGPASPITYPANKILASDDAAALDTVEARMIGFEPEQVPLLMLAREFGLGETRLENIQVEGNAATLPGYPKPEEPPEASYAYKAGVGTGSTSRSYYRERVAFRPVIDVEKCRFKQGCNACMDICPTRALTSGKSSPNLAPDQCVLCSACKEVCEYGALELLPDSEIMARLQSAE
ncbi:MAG: DUF362 domain-containing protein [Deltaproteobacteria bacterium]|nr:DUF362 domain-containing protein [Deltaproteobacteria bacterium]